MEPSKREVIEMFAARAKTANRLLAIWDHRYLTAAKKYKITDSCIIVEEGWHVEEVGDLGKNAKKAVKLAPGGRVIMMDAILEVETIVIS